MRARDQNLELVVVPKWVPAHLHDVYLTVAEREGEEKAASICRKLKHGSSVQLPAVVSPAGCA